MKIGKNAVIAIATLSLLGICAACAPTGNSPKSAETDASSKGLFVSQEVLDHINGGDNSQWAQEFPDEYLSYISGVAEIEPSSTPDSFIGDDHSHAALRATMDAYGAQDGQVSYLEATGASCLACKTVYFSDLYKEKGMAAYNIPYSEVKGKYTYWDCLNCHEGKPGGAVGAQLETGKTLLRNFPTKLSDKDLACAQCHNSLTSYAAADITGKAIAEGKTLSDIDPYRYGVDADALLKAEVEDGVPLTDDEPSGTQSLYMPLADVEFFQGSVHQSMGLTCTDCHMPMVKNSEGKSFTSHNASQGPLENDAALETCLTCHKNQGIGSTDQMRDWVHGKQAELGAKETDLASKLDKLKGLVADGTAKGKDASVLNKAKDNFLHAQLYLDYTKGAVQTPGQKIAHNPTASRDYIERGEKLVDEAIALF